MIVPGITFLITIITPRLIVVNISIFNTIIFLFYFKGQSSVS
jgi:hypothetical protein